MDTKDIQNKQLVILHIPKTAGTSLREIVKNNYKPHECYFIYDKDSPFNTINDFIKLTIEQKKQYKVIMGHIPFHSKLFEGLDPVYVTIMRDPVERVVSYYHHIMERNRKYGIENGDVSLLKYLNESGDVQLDNLQTRLISGMGGVSITDNHLEVAYKNIELTFSFIGLSNSFEKSIEILSTMLCWSYNKVLFENKTKNRTPVSYYSEYEIERIKDMNKFDIALFDYVKDKLKLKVQ